MSDLVIYQPNHQRDIHSIRTPQYIELGAPNKFEATASGIPLYGRDGGIHQRDGYSPIIFGIKTRFEPSHSVIFGSGRYKMGYSNIHLGSDDASVSTLADLLIVIARALVGWLQTDKDSYRKISPQMAAMQIPCADPSAWYKEHAQGGETAPQAIALMYQTALDMLCGDKPSSPRLIGDVMPYLRLALERAYESAGDGYPSVQDQWSLIDHKLEKSKPSIVDTILGYMNLDKFTRVESPNNPGGFGQTCHVQLEGEGTVQLRHRFILTDDQMTATGPKKKFGLDSSDVINQYKEFNVGGAAKVLYGLGYRLNMSSELDFVRSRVQDSKDPILETAGKKLTRSDVFICDQNGQPKCTADIATAPESTVFFSINAYGTNLGLYCLIFQFRGVKVNVTNQQPHAAKEPMLIDMHNDELDAIVASEIGSKRDHPVDDDDETVMPQRKKARIVEQDID